MGSMVKQLGNIYEFPAEFRDHGIVDAEEHWLGYQRLGIRPRASRAVIFMNLE